MCLHRSEMDIMKSTSSCRSLGVRSTTSSLLDAFAAQIRNLDDAMTILYCKATKKSEEIGKEIEHCKVLAASDLISSADKAAVYLNKFRLHQRRTELWEELASAHSALMDERNRLETQREELRLHYDGIIEEQSC